jgi:uncharacterized MAPEG superfamily protein
MKTAIIVLFCLSLMPYLLAFISAYYRHQQLGKVDNQNPREQYTKLQGPGARAVAAQQNCWEALIFYSAALLAVVASNLEVKYLAQAALIVLVGRVLHAIFYLTNLDKLRSLSFLIAIAPSLYLFYVVLAVF